MPMIALASLAKQDALWPIERKEKGKEGKEHTIKRVKRRLPKREGIVMEGGGVGNGKVGRDDCH